MAAGSDDWAKVILGGIFTLAAAIAGPIAVEVYKNSNATPSLYTYEAPNARDYTPRHQQPRQLYCAMSPKGNRVCCPGREPVYETFRRRDPDGTVRNCWRLYCP